MYVPNPLPLHGQPLTSADAALLGADAAAEWTQ